MAKGRKVGAVEVNPLPPRRSSEANPSDEGNTIGCTSRERNRPYLAVPREDHRRRVPLPPNERRLNFGDRWSYAAAPEASDYIKIKPRYELFIGGKFVRPQSKKYFDSINPATEEKLTEIAEANAVDVDLAVKSARKAYESVWGKMSGRERGKYLYRIARKIQEKSRELAVLERWTAAKRSRNRAISISHWWSRIFFTTPAGLTSWNMRSRAAIRAR